MLTDGLTVWIAVYGAVVSSISIVLSIAKHLSEQRRLLVMPSIRRGAKRALEDYSGNATVREPAPNGSGLKTLYVVLVNAGLKDITVQSLAAAVYYEEDIACDEPADLRRIEPPEFPITLAPSRSVEVRVSSPDDNFWKCEDLYARDSTGKRWFADVRDLNAIEGRVVMRHTFLTRRGQR